MTRRAHHKRTPTGNGDPLEPIRGERLEVALWSLGFSCRAAAAALKKDHGREIVKHQTLTYICRSKQTTLRRSVIDALIQLFARHGLRIPRGWYTGELGLPPGPPLRDPSAIERRAAAIPREGRRASDQARRHARYELAAWNLYSATYTAIMRDLTRKYGSREAAETAFTAPPGRDEPAGWGVQARLEKLADPKMLREQLLEFAGYPVGLGPVLPGPLDDDQALAAFEQMVRVLVWVLEPWIEGRAQLALEGLGYDQVRLDGAQPEADDAALQNYIREHLGRGGEAIINVIKPHGSIAQWVRDVAMRQRERRGS